MSCPSHTFWFYHPNNVMWRVAYKLRSSPLCNFLQTPLLPPFEIQVFNWTPCSQTPWIPFFLWCETKFTRTQNSRQYCGSAPFCSWSFTTHFLSRNQTLKIYKTSTVFDILCGYGTWSFNLMDGHRWRFLIMKWWDECLELRKTDEWETCIITRDIICARLSICLQG
jgi:hypothetical protein